MTRLKLPKNSSVNHKHVPVHHGSAGFAHLAVLIICLFLASLATAFIVETRSLSCDMRTEIDIAQVKAVADGAARAGFFDVVQNSRSLPWRAAYVADLSDGSGRRVDIIAQAFDNALSTDLNDASEADLQAVFVGKAGLKPAQAAAIISDIRLRRADRRSAGPAGALSAASRAGQESASLSSARPLAFDTVAELKDLPSVSDALFALIASHVSVMGQTDWSVDDASYGPDGELVSIRVDVSARLESGVRYDRTAVFRYPASNPERFKIDKWSVGSKAPAQ